MLERRVHARSSQAHRPALRRSGKILTSRYRHSSPDRVRVVPGCVDVDHYSACPPQSLADSSPEAATALEGAVDRAWRCGVSVRRMGPGGSDRSGQAAEGGPSGRAQAADRGEGGASAEELQGRIHEAGLEDNVKLLGFVPDQHLAPLYRAANISVVPTGGAR